MKYHFITLVTLSDKVEILVRFNSNAQKRTSLFVARFLLRDFVHKTNSFVLYNASAARLISVTYDANT